MQPVFLTQVLAGTREKEQVGLNDIVYRKVHVMGSQVDATNRVLTQVTPQDLAQIPDDFLVIGVWSWCPVKFPFDELVASASAGSALN